VPLTRRLLLRYNILILQISQLLSS